MPTTGIVREEKDSCCEKEETAEEHGSGSHDLGAELDEDHPDDADREGDEEGETDDVVSPEEIPLGVEVGVFD